jgi:hypothetical protein
VEVDLSGVERSFLEKLSEVEVESSRKPVKHYAVPTEEDFCKVFELNQYDYLHDKYMLTREGTVFGVAGEKYIQAVFKGGTKFYTYRTKMEFKAGDYALCQVGRYLKFVKVRKIVGSKLPADVPEGTSIKHVIAKIEKE